MKFGTKYILSGFWACLMAGLAFVTMCMGCSRVDSQTLDYEELYKNQKNLSSRQLLDLGKQYKNHHLDSALFYYSMVVARYNTGTDKVSKESYIEALTEMGYAHFMSGSDYQQAFTCFLKATDFCLENNLKAQLAANYMNLGCVYSVFEDADFSVEYFKKAFYLSIEQRFWTITLMSFANMASEVLERQNIEKIKPELEVYSTLDLPDTLPLALYYDYFYKGLLSVYNQEYIEANIFFDSMTGVIPDNAAKDRNYVFAILNKQDVYAIERKYDSAITVCRHAEVFMQDKDGFDDLQTQCYKNLSRYYKISGNKDLSLEYMEKALEVQDRHLNAKKLSQILHLKNAYEADRMTERIQKEEGQRQVLSIILLIIIIALTVTALLLLKVFSQKKDLEQKNRKLYLKIQEDLVQYQKERQQREQTKYTGSNLDEERKQILLNRILSIMDQNPEIYAEDFSVGKLASLAEAGEKYISQVINEMCGKNFNDFLAEYRIQEACRRIRDTEHYGNLTIEGIARDLGFKSRSNFYTLFKKEVGMTPAQFRKTGEQIRAES